MNPSQLKDDKRGLFGHLLKHWREHRGFSQLELALASNVSQRHISFLESGRAHPSQEMIVELATVLDIPLREQNVMLTSAGFAAIYTQNNLQDSQLEPIRKAIDFILFQHEPFPAIVVDRYWNLLQSNHAATKLMMLILPEFEQFHPVNLMRSMFDPNGLRRAVTNWEEVAGHLIHRVQREALVAGQNDQSLALLNELLAYCDLPHSNHLTWHSPLLTINFTKGDRCFNFFSTITTLGTPYDVTLQELRIECLFPADDITKQNMTELQTSESSQLI